MESITELFKIGPGPSSSHTLGPKRAAEQFSKAFPDAKRFVVELYGSLSLTGKGHFTDKIILDTLAPKETQIRFRSEFHTKHPNTMVFQAFGNLEQKLGEWVIYSVGGGSIQIEGKPSFVDQHVYDLHTFDTIAAYCSEQKWQLYEYVFSVEPDLPKHLEQVIQAMFKSVERGLARSGVLPGKLKFPRIAKSMYLQAQNCDDEIEKEKNYVTAYAFAVAEENACMGEVVTAPTMGSCGVLPAILYYYYYHKNMSRTKLIRALATAGLFGNIVKTNATISGAEGGCQAEIGVACAMASAAIACLNELPNHLIGYAAEIGMEHHLGLTCDPVGGYVIIPCIERNGVGALRAIDAAHYAKYIGKIKPNFVSFDVVVRTMKNTGQKIPIELKETSLGGLALEVPYNDQEEEQSS